MNLMNNYFYKIQKELKINFKTILIKKIKKLKLTHKFLKKSKVKKNIKIIFDL